MKSYVAARNVDFKFSTVSKWCDAFFNNFTPEEWKTRCEHAKIIEIEFMQQEPAFDRVVDEVVIHLNEVDSDSHFLETETEDEDAEERTDEAEGDSSGILDVQSGKANELVSTASKTAVKGNPCQWFFDRADIIFLVYDPSKLDVGPETVQPKEHQVQERVSAATGVSLSSIRRVKKEARNIKEHVAISFPKPKRTNIKTKVALDGFDQGLLRRTIINYHITEKRIRCIHRKMRDVANYKGCKETLRKEIHKLGFRWKKFESNRKLLIE
ncbi:unnamed protein product [Acanthoscelides obtectus]|uniref:Uncharacterized protein n=1 Tax=Acanthoscelides obtectus TaxID=200917 RepID=A0A9P0PGB1_ACAOB|nr:unnamed protein product [Acanthoscelides obtectus]CAK1628569.1 hypothetical protein AOBTE_LOCUS5280 [Acanthoscelides obtectus]